MFSAEIDNYLSEIARTLAPAGHALMTFFLLNDVSRLEMSKGNSLIGFVAQPGGYSVMDPRDPQAAIALDEQTVRSRMMQKGLTVIEPIRYGSWCGRRGFVSFQDVIVVQKGTGRA